MTQSELQESLATKIRQCFGAAASITALSALAGDASSRRYYRAKLSGAGAVSSVIVMQLPQESALPLSSEELAIFKEPLKELPFLNVHRFFAKVGVRVPKLHDYWAEDGILILEDLGDQPLWDRVQNLSDTEVASWYRKAIDELLIVQLRGTAARDESCIAFQQRFDSRLYMWEFDHFLQYGLSARPDVSINADVLGELKNIFTMIARDLDNEPPVLAHRDYHSWNLMIHEGHIAVIDFQDALLAPAQYDLASLLNDRITDRVITPALETQLIEYFLTRRREVGGAVVSRDHFWQVYLLSAIQRDLKVVGRFYYLDIVKGKPGYMQFVPATLHRLKRNMARLPATQRLIPLLADHFDELR
jgi:hypothetical protein